MKLPRRYAPFVYGVIQAALTTAVATAIATYSVMGSALDLTAFWLRSWGLAWLTMLPVVLLVAPMIQRVVLAMTVPDDMHPKQRRSP